MKRDLLSEATRALRELDEGESSSAEFTRARVMASLHGGRVRRRTRVALLLPIAATFAAASAWGVSSHSGRAFFHELGESLGLVRDPAPANVPVKTESKAKRAPAAATSAAEVASLPSTTPEPELALEVDAQQKPAARPSTPSASAVSAAAERELELYRTAHRAHFGARDWAAALEGWDAYLNKAPRGRFVQEARYNRALCLLRLGRASEARAALEPFARGAYGSYRQREASELLSTLRPGP